MATSHVEATSTMAGAAAYKAASNKKTKYSALQQTHLFVLIFAETFGSWNVDSINFVSTTRNELFVSKTIFREEMKFRLLNLVEL